MLLSLQQIPPKVLLYCDYCGKEFVKRRCDLLKSDAKFGSKNYCSRQCFAKCRPMRYDKFRWCIECTQWIPIKESIIRILKGIEYAYCPKCKNQKLRYNSKKPKLNHKRKKVKRL